MKKMYTHSEGLITASPTLMHENESYQFYRGSFKHCQSFQDTLKRIDPSRYQAFSLPTPLNFTQSYVHGGNHYIAILQRTLKASSPIERATKGQNQTPLWAVASAKIQGEDPFSMTFQTQLARTPSLRQIWPLFQKKCAVSHAFAGGIPAVKEFENGLSK